MKTKINDIGLTPVLAFLALLFFGAPTITAAPGDLDSTFGQGGRVFTNIAVPGFTGFYPNTESMLVQPDGKILVCGRFWEDGFSQWFGTFIVRYMPDGALDTSFGENGKVAFITPGLPTTAVGADIALQADGKIIIIGQHIGQARGIIVRRYTSTGTLDTTFGFNGTSIVTGITGEEGTSITVQPDGKIVGVGWEVSPFSQPYYDAILVFRLNTNGSLDSSFGSAGTGVVTILNGYDRPDVLVQPDGKILVVGTLLNFSDVPPTILLARYNPDGTLDPSFGTGGMVRHRINNMNSNTSAAALQPDGKIVVTGSYWSGSEWRPIVVRYNPNGSVDTSFASNGVFSVGTGFFEWGNTVLLQADGKIIVTWNAPNSATGRYDFALVRLNSNGSPDPSFGVGGRSVFPINAGGTNYAYASDGALQPDGKILVTGYFGYYYTDSHETIALIRVDGGQRSCPNPLDCNEFFVRQHYQDFLNRDPDPRGLAFWTNEIALCGGDQSCIDAKRINVSAAFYVSIEFQETGYLVYRMYEAAYGNLPGSPVPITLSEFLPDTQQIGHGVIVNETGWEQLLENNKQAFMAEFVSRSRFTSAYPTSVTPAAFVDALFTNAGVTPAASDRGAAINEFGSATTTADTAARARALRRVAENSTLAQQEFNKAFVLMQYFGYLRRNPPDPPERTRDFQGYNFWLNKLNQFNGSFQDAEMVKSFLISSEYRQRFEP